MSPAGFKPAIPAIKRPHTHALDHAATGIAQYHISLQLNSLTMWDYKVTSLHKWETNMKAESQRNCSWGTRGARGSEGDSGKQSCTFKKNKKFLDYIGN